MSTPVTPEGARCVAVIDVGSNALRLEIAQIHADGRVEALEHLQRAAPLGQDVFTTGRMETRTIDQAIEILRGFQSIMTPYSPRNVRAVATNAVREAVNREIFVERVFMATGILVEVITSAEEDRLIYSAVRDAFQSAGLPAHDKMMIIELGSGSAEMSIFEEGEVIYSGSHPIGTLRLQTGIRPLRGGPAESTELIRRLVASTLDAIDHQCALRDIDHLIVVGGDVRFAAQQLAEGDPGEARVRVVGRDRFLRFARQIARLSAEKIADKYSLPFQDCEALGPALIVYGELLKRTIAENLHIPFVSMRDGLILDMVAEETGQGLEELERQAYAAAENIGRRFQTDAAHAANVADLACRLFDACAGEHRLGRRERRLLRVAALMHDIGTFISNHSHHKHSGYIIANSDIFGVRAEDRAIVACVARYHRRSMPKPTHLEFTSLTRNDRAIVAKMAAILRVADALDRGHNRKVDDFDVELRPGELALRIHTRQDLTLERLAMRAKGDMFEEVFGRKVILQNA